MKRIGIDVGGTHTDAVLLDGHTVMASHKALTSADVTSGILEALEQLLSDHPGIESDIRAIMLGTTQFTNAVIERRELEPVAAVRLGAPSGRGVPPKIGWPDDIAACLGDHVYLLQGGYLYDGWPLAPIDDREVDRLIDDLRTKKIGSVALSSVFSPMNPTPEQQVAARIRAALPSIRITQSHEIGRLGILERENAALLNASLLTFANRVVDAFVAAIRQRGLGCPFFVSQNDGTLMDAEFARRFPALTFASGPTNSIRGASMLTGLDNAIVVDIGGTTSDIGILQDGFPRESNVVIEVGGVRTNFRMPDIQAVGLGGGSLVTDEGRQIGPRSVGHMLPQEAIVFGGTTLTATDIAVAFGAANIGNSAAVASLDQTQVTAACQTMNHMLNSAIDKMKPSRQALPVILVGGGAVLIGDELSAAEQIVRPENAGVANAIGAAIAKIGGEKERMIAYDKVPREAAIASVRQEATDIALRAGAAAESIQVADIEETSLSYMDGNTTRLRVKVVGDIAELAGSS
ncbi:MAG: hydantoinase/oxoprolinase N-terminal domain-containing protein [Woeseiaceae bacterium]